MSPDNSRSGVALPDPRVTRMAEILVRYSTDLKEGKAVLVWGYSELAKPLLVEVCREAIKAGAGPIAWQVDYPEIDDAFVEAASGEVLRHRNDLILALAQGVQACVRIVAPVEGRAGMSADPRRMAKLEPGTAPLRQHILRNTRMVLTQFPTEAGAQEVGMSLGEFEDYVFNAVEQDWAEVAARQQRLIDSALAGAGEIRITGEDTDLTFSVRGRTFFNCDGRPNMPDGEIMTSPLEDSLQGHIAFSYPAVFPPGGRRAEGIHLWFQDGKVVKAAAKDGQDHLDAMLNLDTGSRYAGEFAFGTNDRLDRWIGNILFDEKMGGTVHLALGQSFPQVGGVNSSSLHWDMIKDLRQGGEIWVDGTIIQKDGRWVY